MGDLTRDEGYDLTTPTTQPTLFDRTWLTAYRTSRGWTLQHAAAQIGISVWLVRALEEDWLTCATIARAVQAVYGLTDAETDEITEKGLKYGR